MTDTKQTAKKQITRRLNVVFREFDLPQQMETNKAIRQAEENYQYYGKVFMDKCHSAMDQEQIEKDNTLLKKFGF